MAKKKKKRSQGYGPGGRRAHRSNSPGEFSFLPPGTGMSQNEWSVMMQQYIEGQLISASNREQLDSLLTQKSRSDKDWDVINEILISGLLLTFDLPRPVKGVSSYQGVLFSEGRLIAFTSQQKMLDYAKYCDLGEDFGKALLRRKTFAELVGVANSQKIPLWIDPVHGDWDHLFVQYTPSTGALEAMLSVPTSNN